jgi:hypothetical protein
MVEINLQWLAIPFGVYAVYKGLQGLWALVSSVGTPDIGPMLGMAMAIQCGIHALASSGIAWLIWKAFRVI